MARANTPDPSKQKNRCQCGCGTPTGARFTPGHDAKHKSTLVHLALGGDQAAIDELEERGWTKFLDKKRETASRPARASRPRAERDLDDEEKAAIAWARYQEMKQAGERLREAGRYYRAEGGLQVTAANRKVILAASLDELAGWTQEQLDAEVVA